MALLNIDFSYDDNVKRSINSAKSSLSTRINDYTGIKRNLNNMSSSTGNLTTANTYIQKKINSLQSKYNKLENFRSAVTTFNTNAEAADQRVASRISTQTNQFYKREGIQTGILYAIGSAIGKGCEWLKGAIEAGFTAVVEGLKTCWENIKQWYNDNKYWIDVVIDAVCLVAAAAAFLTAGSWIAAAFAIWGMAKAVFDLGFDVAAYNAYKDGDMELYKELSSYGLKDVMIHYGGDVGGMIYYGMEIAAAVYGVYKIGKAAVASFKEINNIKKILSPETFKACRGQIIKQTILSNVIGTGASSYTGANTLLDGLWHNGSLIVTIPTIALDTTSFVLEAAKTWLDDNGDSNGLRVIKTFKITKVGYEMISNLKDYVDVGGPMPLVLAT